MYIRLLLKYFNFVYLESTQSGMQQMDTIKETINMTFWKEHIFFKSLIYLSGLCFCKEKCTKIQ